jgi:hypothetical protein
VVTVSVVVPLIDPKVAEMVAVPAAIAVAVPFPSMLATLLAEEPQLTSGVMSRLLPSL